MRLDELWAAPFNVKGAESLKSKEKGGGSRRR